MALFAPMPRARVRTAMMANPGVFASVSKQKFGRGDNGAGYPDELLLTAGELPRIQIFFADDLKTVERVGHERSAFALTIMSIREWNIEVLVNGQIVQQMILLENESDLLVSQTGALFRFQMMHRGLIEKIFAGPPVIVHAENVQKRRFARARGAHHG